MTKTFMEEFRKKVNIWKTTDIRGSSEVSDNDEWLTPHQVEQFISKKKKNIIEEIDEKCKTKTRWEAPIRNLVIDEVKQIISKHLK